MKSLIAAALFAASSASAMAAECAIDQVTYVQPEAPGYTLAFRPAAEPNAWSNLEATLKTPTREFKYSMTASNGYSFNYLVPSWKDAAEDASYHIFLFDKDFKTLELPNKGGAAPAAILTPDIGVGLYYRDINTNSAVQEFLPTDMWRAAGCG